MEHHLQQHLGSLPKRPILRGNYCSLKPPVLYSAKRPWLDAFRSATVDFGYLRLGPRWKPKLKPSIPATSQPAVYKGCRSGACVNVGSVLASSVKSEQVLLVWQGKHPRAPALISNYTRCAVHGDVLASRSERRFLLSQQPQARSYTERPSRERKAKVAFRKQSRFARVCHTRSTTASRASVALATEAVTVQASDVMSGSAVDEFVGGVAFPGTAIWIAQET